MTKDTLLEFPCDFPLKIMGRHDDAFRQAAAAIVEQHVGKTAEPQVNPSRDGRFLALRYTVRAESRAELDALYEALSAHPGILVVL